MVALGIIIVLQDGARKAQSTGPCSEPAGGIGSLGEKRWAKPWVGGHLPLGRALMGGAGARR